MNFLTPATGSHENTSYFVSLKNQFYPIDCLSSTFDFIDFDENGIIGYNDKNIKYINSGRTNRAYIVKHDSAGFRSNNTHIGDTNISVSVFKSKDLVKAISNGFDVMYQVYPEIKTLVREFPESKHIFVKDYLKEILQNSPIKTYKVSNLIDRRTSSYVIYSENARNLVFSKIKANQMSISELQQLKQRLCG